MGLKSGGKLHPRILHCTISNPPWSSAYSASSAASAPLLVGCDIVDHESGSTICEMKGISNASHGLSFRVLLSDKAFLANTRVPQIADLL
jgi:hypothetical protein